MKRSVFLILILLCGVSIIAQTPVGSFRAHTAMHTFISVATDANTVYAASDNGLMLLEKSTIYDEQPVTTSWTKVDGLSDMDIVRLFYDKNHNSLIICYNNGNIDIIRNDRLVNVRDVKDKSLTGSKRLSVCRAIDGQVYLVYPFGIVVFDMDEMVISDTWFTKREGHQFIATDIVAAGERLYVSTKEGIFSIPQNSPLKNDFSRWEQESEWNFAFLASVGGKVFAIKKADEYEEGAQDELYVLSDAGWAPTGKYYLLATYMMSQNDTLLVCNWDGVELMDANTENLYNAYWYENNYMPDTREAVLDGENIWVADHTYGLVQNNMPYFSHRYYQCAGPFADYVERVTSHNGVVVAVHGTRRASTSYAPGFRYPAVSWFVNQEWNYNSLDFLNYNPDHLTYDLVNVAVNPKDETEWGVASWGNGVFKCKDHRVVAHYRAADSVSATAPIGPTYVSGLQYDKKGNLWMTDSYCPGMLKMLEPDGTWHVYNISAAAGANSPSKVVADNLLVDSRGYKWVNFPLGGVDYHLIVFTDNGTYDNPGDDKVARIEMNVAAEVQSSTVYCMAEDHDGEIWIGTDKGVKVIYYPDKVFNGNAYPRNILLEQDGYVSVLLEYEDVTAIAVDGANRKWIGTNKAGVFLMSENGQEQLLHFTEEDHPLFSNQIVDININHVTGEVFFATAKGLVSYKGTATGGFQTYEDLLVYPNPVPSGYTGAVAVNGLKTNSLCKITDSSGKLVWQGYSDGGQLVWYCKDHYGQRPASGVYYVMVSDENGKEKIVAKFLFIH